jgi:hypothetical protein
MSFLTDHKQKFDDLKVALHIDNRARLRRDANGGNTILFVYPPCEEGQYIDTAKNLYPDAHFIDISRLFVDYIDTVGLDEFVEYYMEYENATDQVFKNDMDVNLYQMIINDIKAASENNQIPFIIRTGVLYATGIVNQHIMENSDVLSLSHPIVFFYPAEFNNDELLFLNCKPASKYRCKLVK